MINQTTEKKKEGPLAISVTGKGPFYEGNSEDQKADESVGINKAVYREWKFLILLRNYYN
jgi:hypothetical protein